MSTVRYDSYTRGSQRRRIDAVSGLHFLLMFVAAGLLALTRVEHPVVVDLRNIGQGHSKSVAGARVRQLCGARAQCLAKRRALPSRLNRNCASLNANWLRCANCSSRRQTLPSATKSLRGLVKLVKTAPVSAVTVEVIAGPRGLFTKSVQIGAGVSVTGCVMDNRCSATEGLFGRSRERWPKHGQRADAERHQQPHSGGDWPRPNGLHWWSATIPHRPRLVYLEAGVALKDGDAVVTSGASGEFPRGIKVGVVAVGPDDMSASRRQPACRRVPI